jgi:hypothetical protein
MFFVMVGRWQWEDRGGKQGVDDGVDDGGDADDAVVQGIRRRT